ncbi:MAG: THUMP-like domain-containing protein [Owenweeksia sp.]
MTATELIELIGKAEAQEFLQKNINSEPFRLILDSASVNWKRELASQIALRQKLSKKLPEWTANTHTLFPSGISIEQSSSEATAKLKASLLEGDELLDISGGMGVDTYYLAQKFKRAQYVEQQPELAAFAGHNFKQLGSHHISVDQGNGTDFLRSTTADVIYADPARRDEHDQKLTLLNSYQPNLLPFLDELTRNNRRTIIKTSPMLDISQASAQLQKVSEVWVISHRNDCKEVVYILSSDATSALTKTFNIRSDENVEEFSFTPDNLIKAELTDTVEDYIFEPNASILKAQGTDALAREYGIGKLHPNSNLLTSPTPVPSFPGKIFLKKDVLKPYHTSFKKGKFNIISRNYPDNAEKIAKSLKIKPSGNNYLLATQILSERYVFIKADLIS